MELMSIWNTWIMILNIKIQNVHLKCINYALNISLMHIKSFEINYDLKNLNNFKLKCT